MKRRYGTRPVWTALLVWVSVSTIAQDPVKMKEPVQTGLIEHRANPDESFYHKDGRKTPRLLFNLNFKGRVGSKNETSVKTYLGKHHARFGLPADLGNLKLEEVKFSPLGSHYHYRQYHNGVPVIGAELIVTLSPENRVIQVFNNTYPVEKSKIERSFDLDQVAALALAAHHIEADWLEREPILEALYEASETGFQPIYRVTHALVGSLGTWVTRIDATTGEVLGRGNTTVYHSRGKGTPDLPPKTVVLPPRQAKKAISGKRAGGGAQVFDPDPRTALAREDLQDDSEPSAFNGAYVTGELAEITLADGLYHLRGPWVSITDFDPPSTPPSTSNNGTWTATRGQAGFLDASAYYHISRNQAYVQFLGFSGSTAIADSPIDTDTDGHLGNDFSSYDPLRNRLSFGRGCVDDAEDADIILHFYFQALLHDITSTWAGGDSSGIAQGLGDYWAGSHSYGQINGANFHPEWVFGWDGHGTGDLCWEGRFLDRSEARYDADTNYWADLFLEGFTSAELLSTPLFQAMVNLVEMGQTREEADQIVLSSLFGLGTGVTMPEMAQAVINAARHLYPDGPHAEIYRENFAHHGFFSPAIFDIVKVPITYEGAGVNGIPDPGETVRFRIGLENVGGSSAHDIKVSLFSDAGINLTGRDATYRDLGPGEKAYGSSFEMTASLEEACGENYLLNMHVTWQDQDNNFQQARLEQRFKLGAPRFTKLIDEVNLVIPDNDSQGLTRVLTIENTPSLNSHNLEILGSIFHPNKNDLLITLTRPDGLVIDGWLDEEGSGARFDLYFFVEPFAVNLEGDWILEIRDLVAGDEGVLDFWSINDNFGVSCDPPAEVVRNNHAHFLFTEDNDSWQSTLALINYFDAQGNLLLSAYDDQGALVQELEKIIAPSGMFRARVADLFDEPGRVAYAHASADVFIQGQSEHRSPNGDRSFGLQAPQAGSQILNVPHVAEDPAFRTWGRMANLGQTSLDVDFVNGVGVREPLSLNAGASLGIDFYDFFRGPPAQGTGWGQFENMTSDFPDLGGVEMFGSREDFSTVAGLTLSDVGGKALVFPHIPQDTSSFWSGVALVNPSQEPVEVTAYAYVNDSELPLAQSELTLSPASKRVGEVSSFFPDAEVRGTQWLMFLADEPISGYELVGSQDPHGDLSGIQAASDVSPYHASTFLALDGSGEWAGMAAVSPSRHGYMSAQIEYRDEQGYVLGYDQLVGYHNNKLTLPLRTFSRPAWVSINTYPYSVVFLLKGSADGGRISAFNSLTNYDIDLSELLNPTGKK